MANSVTLRQRKLSSGNIQLYLDINSGGARKTEGLGLTLKPGTDRITKEQNAQTLAMAREIAEQRREEVICKATGIERKRRPGMELFFPYYKECAERRTGRTRIDWYSALNHIEEYEQNQRITFAYIDKQWVEGFRSWLINDATTITKHRNGRGNHLSQNSAAAIFSKLIACVHDAIADGIIDRDPTLGVKIIPIEESEREYLTADELENMNNSSCRNDEVKRAFIFSCMTGLRYSDVKTLRWSQVRDEQGHTRIVFRQQKTKGQMYQDINSTAVAMMGARKSDKELVFDLPGNTTTNNIIDAWAKSAGITKKITFHCSRHTCATLLLTKGADIYTTSKILGHAKVQTTQIYGKIIDSKRRSATDLLDDIL